MRHAALLLALALGACSDTIDPTVGTAQAFSLYGYLDPTADRQALRVAPIYGALDADTARTLAATVTSVERGTGRTATWRDSAVTFRDGSVGHVFVSDYTPTPGATVEVRVEEADGDRRVTTVDVDVPALVEPDLGDAVGSGIDVTYPLRIDAPRVLDAELVFRVAGLPGSTSDSTAVRFDGVAPFESGAAGRWTLDLGFVSTARTFLASDVVGGASLRLVDVTLRAFVANDAWAVPPDGLDEDRIVEPGTFSNVEGGFGFVGAGYWTEVRWTPSLTTQARAGFDVDVDPAGLLWINEVNPAGWVELYNPTLEAVPVGRYAISASGQTAEFPDGTTVSPRGFAVLQVGPSLSDGPVVLLSRSGEPIIEYVVEDLPVEAAFGGVGSYPDGRTRLIGEIQRYRGVDLFRGPVTATPGRPNRPRTRLALVNEVYTAGSDGWVEVVAVPGIANVLLTDDPARPLSEWVPAPFTDGFGVAAETLGRLDLPQGGGEVVLVVLIRDNPPQVVDVRTIGPQTPGLSSGALPDGDPDAWTTGLRPTRGTPNAAARHLVAR
ncbi:hypothetical protein [Rubrivirga marina]|uniref:LTD domain-containing protein n=1 Tax=Rubrivirga marina TaxID=1196024 RepID=A0A271IYM0_9BACT|nr:hypothetical protein [Rubrivirga marina]PAP76292.1 hypothetical protein BSZ37_07445 [Rubrivirga marina]